MPDIALAVSITTPSSCLSCNAPIAYAEDRCVSCDEPVPCPNVIAADKEEEIFALNKRVENATVSAKVGNYQQALNLFSEAAKDSKAVICTNIVNLSRLCKTSELITNFYNRLGSSCVPNSDDEWEMIRLRVDTTLFPYYYNKIKFAALSLNDHGLSLFGDCHIVLKTDLIKKRATVFEQNSCIFYEKHDCKKRVPFGYRATWENRHLLAVAKLHSSINHTTVDKKQFSEVLISNGSKKDADFIEVHIYGNINVGTFEKVILPSSKRDKNMLEIIRNNLKDRKIDVN